MSRKFTFSVWVSGGAERSTICRSLKEPRRWSSIGEIAQQHHDDLFAEVLGLADLGQTFGGGERIGRGEQKDGLAAQMRLAQGLLPDLAGANVLEVEEHVVFRPTVDAKPLLEGDGSDAVLAGMADEET